MEIFIKILFCFLVGTSLQQDLIARADAYFAPHDDIRSLFLHRIESEQKSIYGAVYMFTDQKIAQAFVDAFQRGVDVQIILDQISMGSRAGKGLFLKQHGVPIFIHKTEYYNPYTMPLMHNKFFIFGKNRENSSVLWTGSWNCTLGGSQRNDENVVVLDDGKVIDLFFKNFIRLKTRIKQADA